MALRWAVLASSLAALLGCGAGTRAPAAHPTFAEALSERPRVLWVAAHGDDESVTGGLLAKTCVGDRLPCHFFVINRDSGAECNLPGGCHPDIQTVRYREMRHSALLYRASLEEYSFYNAPLPVESFPSRQALEKIWMKEGDPVALVARSIRRFRPELVLTLGPHLGFTGHPEHQAASRIALAGIRLAANQKTKHELLRSEPPHRPRHTYFVLNKYWFMRLAGDGDDPVPYTDVFDASKPCAVSGSDTRSCRRIRDDFSRSHRSQARDMGGVRAISKFWGTIYLRRIDPFGAEATGLVAELPEPQPATR